MKKQAGFTLVELMVVLTVIALLLSIVVPDYVGRVRRADPAPAAGPVERPACATAATTATTATAATDATTAAAGAVRAVAAGAGDSRRQYARRRPATQARALAIENFTARESL